MDLFTDIFCIFHCIRLNQVPAIQATITVLVEEKDISDSTEYVIRLHHEMDNGWTVSSIDCKTFANVSPLTDLSLR